MKSCFTSAQFGVKLASSTENRMRNVIPFLAIAALAAVFTSGCAGPEQKLGRGMSDTLEITRMGELRRSVEQTTVFDSPSAGYTAGIDPRFGSSRWSARRWACMRWPLSRCRRISPCSPATSSPAPFIPESYKPGRMSEGLFDTDTYMGFSGGDVAPFIPGSRFKVFDN